jgi:hypothetical protein
MSETHDTGPLTGDANPWQVPISAELRDRFIERTAGMVLDRGMLRAALRPMSAQNGAMTIDHYFGQGPHCMRIESMTSYDPRPSRNISVFYGYELFRPENRNVRVEVTELGDADLGLRRLTWFTASDSRDAEYGVEDFAVDPETGFVESKNGLYVALSSLAVGEVSFNPGALSASDQTRMSVGSLALANKYLDECGLHNVTTPIAQPFIQGY